MLRLVPIFIFAVVGIRLFKVQVVDHDYYKAMASETRVKSYELLAKRGEVFMMDGDEVVPAIINERTWTIFVDPSYVADRDKVQARLTEILGDNMIVSWDEVWADLSLQYIEVAKGVNYDTVSKIKAENLRGVGRKETSRRVYPNGQLASQVLGFVNAEGSGSGIEGSQNERLKGKDGMLKTVTDVNDIPLSIGDENIEIPAQNGDNLVLTIDAKVQRKVEKILREAIESSEGAIENGSAVVMNPNTGRFYAIANYPTYNPEEYWNVDDASVFTNRATESLYEPASICKTFTYAAAINEGVLNPDDTFYNSGHTQVEDRIINNAQGTAAVDGLTISFRTALDYSLNTGSVEALRRLGGGSITEDARWKLYNYLYDGFGLGQKTGLELYEEEGLLISPDDPSGEGNAVRYANMTFGQGMNLTMVQVAAGFSALVNGGDYYQPTLLAGEYKNGRLDEYEQKGAVRKVVSPETSATLRDMMREVHAQSKGTDDKAGYAIGTKTGTAETYDENGNYTSDRTNVGVIGFGGEDVEGALPQYVILIRLDGNTLLWGGLNGLPVFSKISNYMLEYLRLEPNI